GVSSFGQNAVRQGGRSTRVRLKKKLPSNPGPSRLRTKVGTTRPYLPASPSSPISSDSAENLTVPERTARVEAVDLQIKNLGPCRYESPVATRLGRAAVHDVGGADRVLLDDRFSRIAGGQLPTFELAGP